MANDYIRMCLHKEEQNHIQIHKNNDMIRKYTAYNLWANQQLVEWMKNADDSLFDKEIESSFPSLRQTVEHIWNAEAGWLNNIRNLAWGEAPSKSFKGSVNEMLDSWLNVSADFDSHVRKMSEEELYAEKPDSRGDGKTAYIDMIHHCMNHSTYHRGQLITMGRQLGLQNPPRTDFIYYIRTISNP
jgi:uncharacterized damage-inducible protein DinB